MKIAIEGRNRQPPACHKNHKKHKKKQKQPKEARHEQTKLKVQNHWPIGQVG